MRKNYFPPVFTFLLLVSTSITWAQTAYLTGTVSTEQDYRDVNFNSKEGNIRVILPGDLSAPGQSTVTLSGTVIAEPTGKTKQEQDDNLKKLLKTGIKIAGKSIPFIAGRNLFEFSVPANSTQPVEIVAINETGLQAQLALKNPVIAPPPAMNELTPDQPAIFTDQKIFLGNGNIPVYANNNKATLFGPTDKFFVTDANGQKTEIVKLAQSPTQTVLSLPAGFPAGTATITRQTGNRNDQTKIRVANLSLTSPNTNLRKDEKSSLTVTIDPKITERDTAEAMQIPIMSLDLKNLTPAVIEIDGGNLQVMNFPVTPGSSAPSDWQATRTITGVKPGGFNISARLYPSIENGNAFAAQKEALTNPAAFNRWADAIKKDLAVYKNSLPDNEYAAYLKPATQNAIDRFPVCRSADELNEVKMAADYLLRFLPEFSPSEQSAAAALSAYHSASENLERINNQPGFVHTDVILEGLDLIKQSEAGDDPEVRKNVTDAQKTSIVLQDDYSEKNISTLRKALEKINKIAIVSKILQEGIIRPGKLMYTIKFDPFAPLTPPTPAPRGLRLNANAPFTYSSQQCGETINLTYMVNAGDNQGIIQVRNTGSCPIRVRIASNPTDGETLSLLGPGQIIPAFDPNQPGLSNFTFTIDIAEGMASIGLIILCQGENNDPCTYTAQFSVGGEEGGRRTAERVPMIPIDFVSPTALNAAGNVCITHSMVLSTFCNTSRTSGKVMHFTAESDPACLCKFYAFGSPYSTASFTKENDIKRSTAGKYSSAVQPANGGEQILEGTGEFSIPKATRNGPRIAYVLGQCASNPLNSCCRGRLQSMR